MEPAPFPTDALLAESAWMRRLARRLVADRADADDAVQDAFVAALEHGERAPRRAWLAAVLRNAVRMRARGDGRRAAREAEAGEARARPEQATDDLAARLDAHRRLVEAVSGLAEPYRTTIALRFLEDLPARDVAARTGVPVKTVHTRIERGLARLRERLDRAFGGRRDAWCLALGELARRGAAPGATAGAGGAGAAAIGGIAMTTAVRWCGAAAVAALAGWVLVRGLADGAATADGERAPATGGATEELASAGADEPRLDAAPAEGARRDPLAAPNQRADAGAAAAVSDGVATFAGFVVDLAGAPVDGVTVRSNARAGGAAHEALSGPDGAFELPVSGSSATLTALGAGYASVSPLPLAWIPPPEPPRVVVAPARRYGGRVVDEDGAPLAGAALAIKMPHDIASALRPGESALCQALFEADAGGRFALEPIGHVPGARIVSMTDGRVAAELSLPDADWLDLVVTLRRDLEPSSLAGRVVDAAGEPVAGALVAAGFVCTTTDARGGFVLGPDVIHGAVRAAKTGYLPAELDPSGLDESTGRSLVLVLGGAPREIAGRVVNPAGEPVPGAIVWSDDATPFGEVMDRRVDGNAFLRRTTVERVLAGAELGDGLATSTDVRGAFRVPGLDREYALQALDARTLAASGWCAAVPGGAELELALAGAPPRRVAGVVRDDAGRPLADAWVHAYRRVPGRDGTPELPVGEPYLARRTGADGGFAYDALAVDGAFLLAGTDDKAQAASVALDGADDLEAIELVVAGRRHLRITLESDPELARLWMILDANGDALMATVAVGDVRASSKAGTFRDGESGLVGVDATARTLVLYRDGEEVRRVGLELSPDEVLEVRL